MVVSDLRCRLGHGKRPVDDPRERCAELGALYQVAELNRAEHKVAQVRGGPNVQDTRGRP